LEWLKFLDLRYERQPGAENELGENVEIMDAVKDKNGDCSRNMGPLIDARIERCCIEAEAYIRTVRILGYSNFLLVGIGSLLSFLGGATILNSSDEKLKTAAGVLALIGGAFTGMHGWLGCERYQADCKRLAARFENLKVRYESLCYETQIELKSKALHELEQEFAALLKNRQTRPFGSSLFSCRDRRLRNRQESVSR
jgi:hypothetical protein